MFNKKITDIITWSLSGVLIVAAVMVFVFGVGGAGDLWIKIILGIIGGLLFVLAALIAGLYFVTDRNNYFLRGGSPKDITYEQIAERLGNYAEALHARGIRLNVDYIEANQDSPFAPLLAYRMLLVPVEKEKPELWASFAKLPEVKISVLAAAIEKAGDVKFAETLKKVHVSGEAILAEFIRKNRKYMCEKMLSYVKNNISRFDGME